MKLALASVVLCLAACAGVESKAGDTFSRCLENEGGTRYLRFRDGNDLGSEVWCEWSYGSPAVFARIAFDRATWDAWVQPQVFEDVKRVELDTKGGFYLDGERVARPPEPRALRVEYNFRALRGAE